MIARFHAARQQEDKGFTLVELLVVIVIIGILAAIAIPLFLNQREKGWKAQVESDLKNAAIVVETFAVDNNGSYAGFDTAALAANDFRESPGVIIEVDSADAQGFVLTGKHGNLPGEENSYDSSAGGLQGW